LGVTLQEGVARELLEETGIEVRVLELIEVFDRIFPDEIPDRRLAPSAAKRGQRFHFVIVDYLCERVGGEAVAGSDVTDVAFATKDELQKFNLTETASRVLKKAFAMAVARRWLR
jgi:ADP-ribose pyrophosphatase YjhB (NUDIX family)